MKTPPLGKWSRFLSEFACKLDRARAPLEISLPDDNSELEPPDPISNSEVKRLSADGSVGFPHVRVGHRQALIRKTPPLAGFFLSVIPVTLVLWTHKKNLTRF